VGEVVGENLVVVDGPGGGEGLHAGLHDVPSEIDRGSGGSEISGGHGDEG
jgi:hypothetical protein